MQCRYCEEVFHDRWSLMQHQKTHRSGRYRIDVRQQSYIRGYHLFQEDGNQIFDPDYDSEMEGEMEGGHQSNNLVYTVSHFWNLQLMARNFNALYFVK